MAYIPDAYDQWRRHDEEQAERLRHLPVCVCCENPIQQSRAVRINDEYFCDHCLEEYYTIEIPEL